MDNKADKTVDPLVTAIAEILDAKQHKMKISDVSLAQTIGVSAQTVRRYMDGKRDMPTSVFVKITKTLELDSTKVVEDALADVSK
jgi:predicted transcriptional regulator